MKRVKAMVLAGYGLNCDYETEFSLKLAGAESHRVHINELVRGEKNGTGSRLEDYHILVFGGGFSWADDHGAGVLMAAKLKNHLGEDIERFVEEGKLILGICNGFQCLVNLGLVPGFERKRHDRSVAITYNNSGNFINTWVNLKVNQDSPCVFTKGLSGLEFPVRHGEGRFYAEDDIIEELFKTNQAVLQYADEKGNEACGKWPANPNGSIGDIAGICDRGGRVFGLMPHPEAYNHYTNHPDWTRKREELQRKGGELFTEEGEGVKIFRNAVEYIRNTL
jgi:phosphoribosylformylglycinamidine synthase